MTELEVWEGRQEGDWPVTSAAAHQRVGWLLSAYPTYAPRRIPGLQGGLTALF